MQMNIYVCQTDEENFFKLFRKVKKNCATYNYEAQKPFTYLICCKKTKNKIKNWILIEQLFMFCLMKIIKLSFSRLGMGYK